MLNVREPKYQELLHEAVRSAAAAELAHAQDCLKAALASRFDGRISLALDLLHVQLVKHPSRQQPVDLRRALGDLLDPDFVFPDSGLLRLEEAEAAVDFLEGFARDDSPPSTLPPQPTPLAGGAQPSGEPPPSWDVPEDPSLSEWARPWTDPAAVSSPSSRSTPLEGERGASQPTSGRVSSPTSHPRQDGFNLPNISSPTSSANTSSQASTREMPAVTGMRDLSDPSIDRVLMLLESARQAMTKGDVESAWELVSEAKRGPVPPSDRAFCQNVGQAFGRMLRQSLDPLDRPVIAAIRPEQWRQFRLNVEKTLLLGQADGMSTLADLIDFSGLDPLIAMRSLVELLRDGLLEVPGAR